MNFKSGHTRAQRRYSVAGVVCERCGERPALDRHHRDGDSFNNERENVEFLCRSCHTKEHKPRDVSPCEECGDTERVAKWGKRRGLCCNCWMRMRRAA